MSILNIEAFILAITILTLTPGLDTAMVIRNTTRGGLSDGVMTSFGICSGLYVHALFSAIGISAVLAQSAELFQFVKFVGAAYLIWLGANSLLSLRNTTPTAVDTQINGSGLVALRSLREGFLSNVLNPKTAVFYLAFLPQFIDPKGSALLQSLFMASIHFVIAMIWQCSLSSVLVRAKSLLNNVRFLKWMEGTTGAVLVALGVKLMLEDPIIES
ncbi:LysE family translocator [Vibrio sp. YMD68]|uniref:LysE family translocator n=1 Tax=Vibrio sp. YMD68 TaxID=3042300 RepID=UPI002499B997|nr:LysE family translocator [Vibrio sp. YMD68]WGW01721.1 LysE family translocator [Vibrio sp. YMD68]